MVHHLVAQYHNGLKFFIETQWIFITRYIFELHLERSKWTFMSGAQWQVRPVEMWSYLDLADQLTLFKPGGELHCC